MSEAAPTMWMNESVSIRDRLCESAAVPQFVEDDLHCFEGIGGGCELGEVARLGSETCDRLDAAAKQIDVNRSNDLDEPLESSGRPRTVPGRDGRRVQAALRSRACRAERICR